MKNENNNTKEEDTSSPFRVASDFVRRGGDASFSEKCTQTIQLKLYGLFKQATCGNCNEDRPWSADFRGCAKWDAWNEQIDKTQEEAEAEYVDLVNMLAPHHASRTDFSGGATKSSTHGGGGGGGMGVSVSTMASVLEEEEMDEKEDDVFVYCSRGNTEKVMEILNAQNVNACDDQQMTLLHWACDRGHKELVRLLLSKGANVDAKDEEGMTPFACAVLCENDDIAEALIRAGANPDIPNNDGELPSENYSEQLETTLAGIRGGCQGGK